MDLDSNIDAVCIIDAAGDEYLLGAGERRYAFASVTKLLAAHVIADAVSSGFTSFDELVEDAAIRPDHVTLADLISHAGGVRPEGQDPIEARIKRIYTNEAFDIAERNFIARLGHGFETSTIGKLFADGLAGQLRSSITIDGSCAKSGSGTFDDLAIILREIREPEYLDHDTHAQLTSVHLPELSGIVPGWGNYDRNTWGLGYEIKGNKNPHWTGSSASEKTYGHFGQSGVFVMHDPVNMISIACASHHDFGPWAKEVWPAMCEEIYDTY